MYLWKANVFGVYQAERMAQDEAEETDSDLGSCAKNLRFILNALPLLSWGLKVPNLYF